MDDNSLYMVQTKINGTRHSLFDLATWKNGLAFRKIHFSESGVPIIKIAELNNGIGTSTAYTEQIFDEDVHLLKGDLLFSWSGNPQTSIDIFRFNMEEGWLNQHIFKVIPNFNLVNGDFFYFLMKWLKPRFTQIATNKQTTGLGHVTIADIKRLNLIIPNFDIQQRIVKILKPLDDKIENNRRMNETLEGMAQALFKSWFVDFDPVLDNALAAGKPIPKEFARRARQRKAIASKHKPLPPEIRSLFPSEFQPSEHGPIPKGWKYFYLGEHCESVSITKKKDKSQLIFLNTGDVEKGIFLHNNYSDTKSMPGQAKKSIQKGDILYSEIRPINEHYAYVNFSADDYVVSTKLMVIRGNTIDSRRLYHLLTSPEIIKKLQFEAESRSGTFPQIRFENIKRLLILMATTAIEERFISFLHKVYDEIDEHNMNNIHLNKIKDILLAKLLSGEIEI